MSDQNSAVVYQIRPDDLMGELEIKKDAYYAYMKFLGLKAEKDHDGKAYLSEEQANLMRELRQHVTSTGKMDGFVNSNGAAVTATQASPDESSLLAIAEESALDAPTAETLQEEPVQPGMEDELIRMAAELKTQQLVMMPMVVQELASRMSYEDLPEDMRAQVDRVRAAAAPKFQPAEVAGNILGRWRDRNQQQQQAVTAA